MKRNVLNKTGFVLAIAGAAVIGGATTALVQAAIPSSSDGQIHACYRNSANLTQPKGGLRVIDDQAGATCASNETALNWNASPQSGVLLKDDNAQPIGSIIDLADNGSGVVYNNTLNRLISMDPNEGYSFGRRVALAFESSDCTGQSYVYGAGDTVVKTNLLRWIIPQTSGTVAYATVANNATPQQKTIQSVWYMASSNNDSSYTCGQDVDSGVPIYSWSQATLPFSVPVALPFKL